VRARSWTCVVLLVALPVPACTDSTTTPQADVVDTPTRTGSPRLVRGLFPPVTKSPADAPEGWKQAACELPLEYVRRIRRGYYPGRSPEIVLVPRAPNYIGSFASMSHSGPWGYVQHVPLVFYGPGYIRDRGELSVPREVTVADLAPTVARLLGTPFPKERPGRPIEGVLVPKQRRPTPPKVIVNVVWDGGGSVVLDTWPGAWPHLEKLASGGTSVTGVISGSSPSVTPAIHANIGTGAFPKEHGITNIPIRHSPEVVGGSILRGDPKLLELPTLADLYDQAVGNRAQIGFLAFKFFHLGMMGHGASLPGGDKDIAVVAAKERGDRVTSPGRFLTNRAYYSMPSYVTRIPGFEKDRITTDVADGRRDFKWLGHIDLRDTNNVRHSPVWSLYQSRIVTTIMKNEGFGSDDITDLFYVNYKEIDDVGHNWNMLFPEMRDILEYSDRGLGHIVRFLNKQVGENQWVVVMTADHGQAPDALALGSWPISQALFRDDIARHFGIEDDNELFQGSQSSALFLDADTMAEQNITAEEIADFIINYRLGENVADGQEPPEKYMDRKNELLFSAAWPTDRMGQVWACAKKREGQQ
jgi:Type I phosphodiesterase / nucleotide pyrophosphatase